MRQPSDPPPGLIPVPLGKQCLLLLTEREYLAGHRRGKRERGAQKERVLYATAER